MAGCAFLRLGSEEVACRRCRQARPGASKEVVARQSSRQHLCPPHCPQHILGPVRTLQPHGQFSGRWKDGCGCEGVNKTRTKTATPHCTTPTGPRPERRPAPSLPFPFPVPSPWPRVQSSELPSPSCQYQTWQAVLGWQLSSLHTPRGGACGRGQPCVWVRPVGGASGIS